LHSLVHRTRLKLNDLFASTFGALLGEILLAAIDEDGEVGNFDYHGNFDHVRFLRWFKVLCAELGLKYGDCNIFMDGAKYHKTQKNPPPTASDKREKLVKWVRARQDEMGYGQMGTPPLATEAELAEKGPGKMTKAQLFLIVKANKPEPHYEVFDLAKGIDSKGNPWQHHICFTPPYCHRANPIEIVWAQVKNPITRGKGAKNIADLISKAYANRLEVAESALLGAYTDARQWEDEMWLFRNAFANSGATTDDRPLVSRMAAADMPEEPDRGDDDDDEYEEDGEEEDGELDGGAATGEESD
jgi:hypothetical protein